MRKKLESALQARVRKRALMELAVHSIKVWETDWPDLLFLIPHTNLDFLMELKREGEVPRPTQSIKINMLRALGRTVYWADNEQEAMEFIRHEVEAARLHEARNQVPAGTRRRGPVR